MEYKRWTKRRKDNSVTLSLYSNYEEEFSTLELIIMYLAELEDKIENGTLVPKQSVVDCGNTSYCVCTVDTDNLLVVDEYETKAEAEKRLEELKNE